MLIIKFMGGLGNQMFQYAFGVALSHSTGKDVFFDPSWFEEIKSYKGPLGKRVYELEYFNIKPKFVSQEEAQKHINEIKVRNSYLPGFLRHMFKIQKYKVLSDKVFEKEDNLYEPELLEFKGDRYYEGYFQDEEYFIQHRDEILQAFTLKAPLDDANAKMLEKIKNTNSVSLHMRRGDYLVLQETFGLCTLKYYKNAIEYMASKTENPHFFLFSDDIEWVRENLKINYPCTIVDINTPQTGFFDLELMKNCKHNIIANSSFSWWGAWLNKNPDRIIIAPKTWFLKGDRTNIVPKNWVKL